MKIIIDDKEISCKPGQTVLEVALDNNIDIPTMCYNPLFGKHHSGTCRVCLVEVLVGGKIGMEPACNLAVAEGLAVSTKNDKVYSARRTMLELLLSEHVQDCRNCPSSGNCNLARLCRDYDLNGVPVCAECPNQKEACLLTRKILCLGPVTYANCGAYCTRRGERCEGCHSVLFNKDVLGFAAKAYKENGIAMADVIRSCQVFSFEKSRNLEQITK